MLIGFISAKYSSKLDLSQLIPLVNAYEQAMNAQWAHKSIVPVFEENDLEICQVLIGNYTLKSNEEMVGIRQKLVWKYGKLHPDQIMEILSKDPDNRYADSLIVMFAFRNPENCTIMQPRPMRWVENSGQ